MVYDNIDGIIIFYKNEILCKIYSYYRYEAHLIFRFKWNLCLYKCLNF